MRENRWLLSFCGWGASFGEVFSRSIHSPETFILLYQCVKFHRAQVPHSHYPLIYTNIWAGSIPPLLSLESQWTQKFVCVFVCFCLQVSGKGGEYPTRSSTMPLRDVLQKDSGSHRTASALQSNMPNPEDRIRRAGLGFALPN